MDDSSVCQICGEPIWSFICPDCLAKDINKQLSERFSDQFRDFNKQLLSHFKSDLYPQFEYCLHCKRHSEVSICTFCYILEVYQWVKNKDRSLSKRLLKMALTI